MFKKLGDLTFEPTVRNPLYGNTEHSEQVNVKTFEIIQNYIAETGWF